MSKRQVRAWAGIDAGKGHHWATVVDGSGGTLWSKKIDNDESAILTAIGEVLDLADEIHWAVDISGTSSALLLALLAAHGQQAVYVPDRTVHRMAGAYRGEAKTDARDAYVIAETARQRRDFATIDVPAQLAADLALLTAHRSDLVADRRESESGPQPSSWSPSATAPASPAPPTSPPTPASPPRPSRRGPRFMANTRPEAEETGTSNAPCSSPPSPAERPPSLTHLLRPATSPRQKPHPNFFCLARHGISVLFAMLRDGTFYESRTSTITPAT